MQHVVVLVSRQSVCRNTTFFSFLFFFLLVKSGIAFCTVGRLGCTLRGASVTVSHTHKKNNKKHFEKKQMSRRFD